MLIAICEDMIFGKPFSPLSLNVINGSLLTGSKKSLMTEGEELDCGYTGVDFILRSRVGEDCSCCSQTVLPGPAWVLLKCALRRIKLSSVLFKTGEDRKKAKVSRDH